MRRIRILEEMEDLHGPEWRRMLHVKFNSEGNMDYLLGTVLTDEQEKILEENNMIGIHDPIRDTEWTISKDATVVTTENEMRMIALNRLGHKVKALLEEFSYEQILDQLLLQARGTK